MGNVNGREGSIALREEEEGVVVVVGDGGSEQSVVNIQQGGQEEDDDDDDGELILMGQNQTQSPLMFTPQVPVAPLERPGEMHIASQPWMQTYTEHDDVCLEKGVPTIITWSYGGKEVAVEGTWDNWKTRKPLQPSGKDFTIMKVLPSGVYQYRFVVDGQWRCAPDLPWAQDDGGNAYNILNLQDYVPENVGSISSFEPPQSPDTSYNNARFGSDDFAKEPPFVPAHLHATLLNAPSVNMEIPPPLSRPQHVVLNHLYMQKESSSPSVVALGSTHRFLAKYVTLVLYKSLQK